MLTLTLVCYCYCYCNWIGVNIPDIRKTKPVEKGIENQKECLGILILELQMTVDWNEKHIID